jgi:hypothetical protein
LLEGRLREDAHLRRGNLLSEALCGDGLFPKVATPQRLGLHLPRILSVDSFQNNLSDLVLIKSLHLKKEEQNLLHQRQILRNQFILSLRRPRSLYQKSHL